MTGATWEYGGEVSWIEVRLAPVDEGTQFTLEHVAPVDDERWAKFGPGALGVGWYLSLHGLASHLSTGTAPHPADAAAWMASPEGVQFMTASSEAWYAANVGTGIDEAAARSAADRATAAYTASP